MFEVFQLSLAVSCGRKASGWLIQFTFCPSAGGEDLAWHQMPLNGCFAKKKNGCLFLINSASLLLSCLTSFLSFICLSKGWFLSDPVAMDSAGVWSRTCVQCTYYGMLRKERARWSARSLWCHTQVCKSLCVFNAFCVCLLSSREEQEATWRDGHQTQTLIGWYAPWTLSDHRHVLKPLVYFCWTIRSLISAGTERQNVQTNMDFNHQF